MWLPVSGAATLKDVIRRNEGKVFRRAPRHLTDRQKFEERIFQEIRDKEEAEKRRIVEDLVNIAKARGFTIDDLLRILESGAGVQGLLDLLKSQ
jgi:hypothetical protein